MPRELSTATDSAATKEPLKEESDTAALNNPDRGITSNSGCLPEVPFDGLYSVQVHVSNDRDTWHVMVANNKTDGQVQEPVQQIRLVMVASATYHVDQTQLLHTKRLLRPPVSAWDPT
jgi:hypothetical protein